MQVLSSRLVVTHAVSLGKCKTRFLLHEHWIYLNVLKYVMNVFSSKYLKTLPVMSKQAILFLWWQEVHTQTVLGQYSGSGEVSRVWGHLFLSLRICMWHLTLDLEATVLPTGLVSLYQTEKSTGLSSCDVWLFLFYFSWEG